MAAHVACLSAECRYRTSTERIASYQWQKIHSGQICKGQFHILFSGPSVLGPKSFGLTLIIFSGYRMGTVCLLSHFSNRCPELSPQ